MRWKVRGRAELESNVPLIGHIATAIGGQLGWRPELGKFHLFRVEVEDVTFIRWVGNNDQYVTRWPRRAGFVRRGNRRRASVRRSRPRVS